MSIISDGLTNVYAITDRISALRQGQETSSQDPIENFQYLISKNFNDMLSSLLSSDDDDEDKSNDIFSSIINGNYSLSSLANNSAGSASSTDATAGAGGQSAESLAMQAALLSNQAYSGLI